MKGRRGIHRISWGYFSVGAAVERDPAVMAAPPELERGDYNQRGCLPKQHPGRHCGQRWGITPMVPLAGFQHCHLLKTNTSKISGFSKTDLESEESET
jgi:hypothetical protein